MKKTKTILLWVVFLWLVFLFLPSKSYAAYFKISPSTISKSANETFSVDVIVDAGSDEIRGVDIYVTFDGSVLEAQSVTEGSFFSTVTNNITSGQVYIAGLMDDVSTKTGSGTVASITFKALKSGTTTIGFNCDSSVITKADANGTNIMQCSANQTASVTIGDGGNTNTTNDSTTTGGEASAEPTGLPRSGVFDKMTLWSKMGIILVLVGGILKFAL